MNQILLICKDGVSAKLIAKRMQQKVLEQKQDIEINCCGLLEMGSFIKEKQLILLAPQIRYYEEDMKIIHPGIVIKVIEMDDYATMDVEAILNNIK